MYQAFLVVFYELFEIIRQKGEIFMSDKIHTGDSVQPIGRSINPTGQTTTGQNSAQPTGSGGSGTTGSNNTTTTGNK